MRAEEAQGAGDIAVEGEDFVELGDGEEEADVFGDVGEGDFAVEAGEPFEEGDQGTEAGGFHEADGVEVEEEEFGFALVEEIEEFGGELFGGVGVELADGDGDDAYAGDVIDGDDILDWLGHNAPDKRIGTHDVSE